MDVLITIKPFDLDNKVIRKNTTRVPGTIRKSKIDNDVVDKFRNFDKVRKGVISSDVLYSIKPELMITFPKYEKKLSFKEVISKLATSNALVSEKYGRKDLKVTPEQFNESFTRELSKVEEQIVDLTKIKEEKEKMIIEQQHQISDLKRRKIVLKTIIDEYENKEQVEDDIKLIA